MTLQRVENLISHVLRLGVGLSLGVIIAGTIMSFVHHPAYLWSHDELLPLVSPNGALPTLRIVAAGLMSGSGQAMVMLGLLFLIATPVVRVAVSVIVFLIQRDWIFVAITLVVLAALITSFLLGGAGG